MKQELRIINYKLWNVTFLCVLYQVYIYSIELLENYEQWNKKYKVKQI